MNKSILTFGVACLVAGSANAQSLIAGFDFSNITNANYSDLGNGGATNDGNNANVYGSFSFNDLGSPIPAINQSVVDLTAGSFLDSSIRVAGVNDEFAEAGGGFEAADNDFLGSADGGYFQFDFSPVDTFEDFQFSFAAGQTQAGTSTLGVSYSTGGSYVSLGTVDVDALTSAGGEAFAIDASGFQASNVSFRIDFVDIATSTAVVIDNVQLSGTVVPEPSAYAAIFGAVALAFAAVRRRK